MRGLTLEPMDPNVVSNLHDVRHRFPKLFRPFAPKNMLEITAAASHRLVKCYYTTFNRFACGVLGGEIRNARRRRFIVLPSR